MAKIIFTYALDVDGLWMRQIMSMTTVKTQNGRRVHSLRMKEMCHQKGV